MLFTNGVSVQNPDHRRGSIVLSESQDSPVHASFEGRKVGRKKTPPVAELEASEASDSSAPMPSRGVRSRYKKVPARLAALRIQDDMQPNAVVEPSTPSPNNLAPDSMDFDVASTPKAATFDINGGTPIPPRSRSPRRLRKISTEGRDVRTRKISSEGRARKTSSEDRRVTDSGAEEGDDEGYDDLLSAYESEDGFRKDNRK